MRVYDGAVNRRLYRPITKKHLRSLAQITNVEREEFFTRNPDSVPLYKNRFLAAALCQGAARHYLGRKNGVRDFDIHFFYEQHPVRKQMSRRVRSRKYEVPDFGLRKIDFIRTVVPAKFVRGHRDDVVASLRQFLKEQPTRNAHHLVEGKAVVGLVPDKILGTVVWPNETGKYP